MPSIEEAAELPPLKPISSKCKSCLLLSQKAWDIRVIVYEALVHAIPLVPNMVLYV